MIVDPSVSPKSDVYRLMIRSILPRPIAWVATISEDGVRNLAPFSFFTGVSSDPPTLCFAPGRRSVGGGKKDTLANVEASGEFVVNVVTESLAERMNESATDFPPGVDEFERAGVTPVPGERVRAPRVAESPVQMECRLVQTVDVGPDGAGGATLVIGEIVLFHVDDAVLTDGKVDPALLQAVGRMGGMDYTRTRDRFTMVRKKYDAGPGN